MLAFRRVCSLRRFRFFDAKTLISSEKGRSYRSLIFSRLQFCEGEIPSKKSYFARYFNLCNLDEVSYHNIADETLDAITELFEDLGESPSSAKDYDVHLSAGVLTVNLGAGQGTYVINKQSPNKQIWLSSPASGPKRYDYANGAWIYSHDGISLHSLLSSEISNILGYTVDFTVLLHGKSASDKLVDS